MGKPWDTVVAISDSEDRRSLAKILGQLGIDAMCVGTFSQCRELLDKGEVGLVFSSEYFPDGDFRALLTASQARKLGPSVIVTSPRIRRRPQEAIQLGAFDVIGVPFRPTDVEWAVIKASRGREALAETKLASPLVSPANRFENFARHAS
jgi:DNA-binding NtrC family response regulator